MSILEIIGIILISFAILVTTISVIMLDSIITTRKHLQQIERKIDEIHSEWRAKNGYVHPTAYPFITKDFFNK